LAWFEPQPTPVSATSMRRKKGSLVARSVRMADPLGGHHRQGLHVKHHLPTAAWPATIVPSGQGKRPPSDENAVRYPRIVASLPPADAAVLTSTKEAPGVFAPLLAGPSDRRRRSSRLSGGREHRLVSVRVSGRRWARLGHGLLHRGEQP
jgi:hypothetical protein